MENPNTVINFKELYENEKTQAPTIEEEHKTYTEEDFVRDLLEEIDEVDVKELGLAEVPDSGVRAEEQAEYFIQRYKQVKQECDNIKKVASERIESYSKKVSDWRDAQLRKREGAMAYYMGLLETFAQEKLASKKKKSLSLIEGTLSFSKQQPLYDTNEDKLRAFLRSLNQEAQDKFLEPVPDKVKWGEFKKVGKLDEHGIFRYGEIAVPGVVVTQRPDKFVIK